MLSFLFLRCHYRIIVYDISILKTPPSYLYYSKYSGCWPGRLPSSAGTPKQRAPHPKCGDGSSRIIILASSSHVGPPSPTLPPPPHSPQTHPSAHASSPGKKPSTDKMMFFGLGGIFYCASPLPTPSTTAAYPSLHLPPQPPTPVPRIRSAPLPQRLTIRSHGPRHKRHRHPLRRPLPRTHRLVSLLRDRTRLRRRPGGREREEQDCESDCECADVDEEYVAFFFPFPCFYSRCASAWMGG